MRNRFQFVVPILTVASILAGQARGAEEFYVNRLRDGQNAYQAKALPTAMDDLRIACFGLLDDPDLLAEGLAVLALAQNAAGKPEAALGTISRFLEVERRFKPWATVALAPALARDFEKLVAAKVPGTVLPVAAGPSRAAPDQPTAVVGRSPAPPPAAPKTAAASASSSAAEKARRLVQQGKVADARPILDEALAADPGSRELRLLLLEAAYTSKEWKLAAAQGPFVEPFADGEEPSMMYMAIAAYETGDLKKAQALFKKARPLVSSNAFIEYYAKRILPAP